MSLWFILDKDKKPVKADVITSALFPESQRRVQATHIADCYISTVFLGLDHNISGNGPPLLFETMVFGSKVGDGEYMKRYETWDEAQKGHWESVKEVMSWS